MCCSTKSGSLEYWWGFSLFWRQLFHLFLADWGFPSLGIKQFQAGGGIAPMIIFCCFFLRQKMIYLLMDSVSLAQSQAHWSKRGLGCTPCSSLSHCLFLSSLFFLPTVFGDSFSYSISVISHVLYFPRHPYLCTAFFPVTHLQSHSHFPCVSNDPLLFKLFSRGCPNPSFSTSVHRPQTRVLRRRWQYRFTNRG